jgi:hypothetical protein
MPQQQALPTGHQPASWDDIIAKIAADEGIAPELAQAVAKKESSTTPDAVGDSGQAIGMFQLHAGAAEDTGTTDRSDPIANIRGGVRYLRQLDQKYNGDVQKTLQAYNGGMANVDAGTVSPGAQAYAAEVQADILARLRGGLSERQRGAGGGGRGDAAGRGRGGGAGPGPPPGAITTDIPTPTKLLKTLAEPFDPWTPEGRVNWASTIASTAVSLLPGGRVVVPLVRGTAATQIAPWIARVLGPPVAAGIAGGTERGVEQARGTTPRTAPGPLATGVRQGVTELAGQGVMWGGRRFYRAVKGATVARASREALTETAITTKASGRTAISQASQDARDRAEAARMMANVDVQVARERVAPSVARAAEARTRADLALQDAAVTARQSVGDVAAQRLAQQKAVAAQEAATAIEAAKTAAADRLVAVETAGAEAVQQSNQAWQRLYGQPPSHRDTADAVLAVVSPGRRGVPKGPAQIAFSNAGKRVETTAENATETINFSKLQDALEEMRKDIYPDELVGAAQTPLYGGRRITPAQFQQELSKMSAEMRQAALDASVQAPPLPHILGLMERAPLEDISFATAHKLKKLLDERVTFDKVAKSRVEGLMKGIRGALRKEMSVNQAYDEAASAYEKLVPIYRESIGKEIIENAQEHPDALMHVFKPDRPLEAEAAKQLIIEQAAVGGDPTAGLRAWDAVRAAYTYNDLIAPGIEKLGPRVDELLTRYPDFARTVYHDDAGQQILNNLAELGRTYQAAVIKESSDIAAEKPMGQRAVQGATSKAQAVEAAAVAAEKTVGRRAVRTVARATAADEATGKTQAKLAETTIRARAAQAIREARQQSATTTRAVVAQGTEAVEDARTSARIANVAVQMAKARFTGSSLATTREWFTQVADLIQATGGKFGWFKTTAALRLLKGPEANDILEWAAFSTPNRQRFAAFMLGQLPDRDTAVLLREIGSIVRPESDTRAVAQPAP